MSDNSAKRASYGAENHYGLRIVALAAVAIGVLLLAAAAFAFSYAGIHVIALKAGVPASLARLYPLIFDAMLVVGGAAVLSLRGAGPLTRCYAWLSVLVLLAAAAGADALHASGAHIPHRPAAVAVAITPWALVLIGFGLLLAMLRHARLRRAAREASRRAVAAEIGAHGEARAHWRESAGSPAPVQAAGQMSGRAPTEPGIPAPAAIPAPASIPAPAAIPAPASVPAPAPGATLSYEEPDEEPADYSSGYQEPYARVGAGELAIGRHTAAEADLALDAEADYDDPTSDEARTAGQSAAAWVPQARAAADARHDYPYDDDYPAGSLSAAPTPDFSPAPTPDLSAAPAPDFSPAPTPDVGPDPTADHGSSDLGPSDLSSAATPGLNPASAPDSGHAPAPDPHDAPTSAPSDDGDPGSSPMPHFNRMSSSPTPPDD